MTAASETPEDQSARLLAEKRAETKAYVGTKIVRARPEHNPRMGLYGRDGYKVIYPDGYESWSPKETFEQAYREVSDEEKALVARVVAAELGEG